MMYVNATKKIPMILIVKNEWIIKMIKIQSIIVDIVISIMNIILKVWRFNE